MRRPWGNGKTRRAGSGPAAFGLALLAALLLAPAQGWSVEKSASVSLTVEAGRWSATRLRNLPKGGSLALEMTVDGAVDLLLLGQEDYAKFPKSGRPLFRGRAADSLSFTIVLPAAGDYYVLVDNRAGGGARSFTLALRASTAADAASDGKDMQSQLDQVERKLRQVFRFGELDIRVARCGTAKAGGGDSVLVCSDLARRLLAETGSQQRTQDALLFALMHRVGQVLLKTWDTPLQADEDLADEFASVLMILFKRADRARRNAEFFAKRPSQTAAAAQPDPATRQPLSARRAGNILRWLDDPNLLRRWQAVLLPQMQTELLQGLRRQPPAWSDPRLIERELAKR